MLKRLTEPLLNEAIIADGLLVDNISWSRTEGRRVVCVGAGLSVNSFSRLADCALLNAECLLALVLAARFSADDLPDDNSSS